MFRTFCADLPYRTLSADFHIQALTRIFQIGARSWYTPHSFAAEGKYILRALEGIAKFMIMVL